MADPRVVTIDTHHQRCGDVAREAVRQLRAGRVVARITVDGVDPDSGALAFRTITLDMREVDAIAVEDGRWLLAFWSSWWAADELLRGLWVVRPDAG